MTFTNAIYHTVKNCASNHRAIRRRGWEPDLYFDIENWVYVDNQNPDSEMDVCAVIRQADLIAADWETYTPNDKALIKRIDNHLDDMRIPNAVVATLRYCKMRLESGE